MRIQLTAIFFLFLFAGPAQAACGSAANARVPGSAALEKLADEIDAGKHDRLLSLIVERGGDTLVERYFQKSFKTVYEENYKTPPSRPLDGDTPLPVQSVTKSVIALLMGAAIEKGFVKGLDQKISEFFPDYKEQFENDPKKASLTIEHLLSMSGGMKWNEWGPYNAENDAMIMYKSPDWVDFILKKPMLQSENPGDKFYYNGGL
ncbi:MAG TPA: serine hydrolase, partial [Bdellovibrionales bacterium]|nr:serine hydrolase [Bdellovibrionales bacterium]